ncbi:MAG: tetratricopeptide repeat protein [Balneolaceae bacterium]|nr:tetratricopeptide repeat protein [Balneolaceae bacterium]
MRIFIWLFPLLIIGCSTSSIYKVSDPKTLLHNDELTEAEIDDYKRAINEYDSGNYTIAKQIFAQLLEANPNSSEVIYELAMTESALGNSKVSLELVKRGQTIDAPNRTLFYHIQGIELDNAGYPKRAKKAFQKAISLNNDFHLAHYSLAITSVNLGEVDEAIVSLQNAIRANFGHASSHLLLGRIYHDMGNHVPALLAYTYFVQIEQDSPRTLQTYDAIQSIFNLATKDEETGKVEVNLNLGGAMGNGFTMYEMMLMGYSATRFTEGEYDSEIDFIAKGYAMILEQYTEHENTGIDPFFVEQYLPYLVQVYNHDYVEPMVYLTFQNSLLPEVTPWIDANLEKCEEYLAWEPDL